MHINFCTWRNLSCIGNNVLKDLASWFITCTCIIASEDLVILFLKDVSNDSKLGGCRHAPSGSLLNALLIGGSSLRFRKSLLRKIRQFILWLKSSTMGTYGQCFFIFVDKRTISHAWRSFLFTDSLIILGVVSIVKVVNE